jgi:hypothetical protein
MGMDFGNGDWPLEWRKCSSKYQHEKKVEIHMRYLVQWKNVHYKINDNLVWKKWNILNLNKIYLTDMV